ncbi:Gag protein [Danaus plexippus plexippus]|uniref:Gag protein n=1 Tax=Danaus plexippus plexippus TaxID=278856 RepID=A0A212FAT5_DANPL|nr:Gag protein [Danaus plexippus plexippus]
MENRVEKNSPRVGPGIIAGESHTPASAGGRPMYTGGATNTIGGEEERRSNDHGNMTTDSDLQNVSALGIRPGSAHLTVSRPDPVSDVEETNARNQFERELGLGAALRIPRVLLTRLPTGLDRSDRDSDDDLSDSSAFSAMSLESGRSSMTGADRPRKRKTESDGMHALSRGAAPTSKKGRRRPPMPGQYVGLATAQAAYNKAKEEALRLQAEKDVAEIVKRAKERSASRSASPVPNAATIENVSAQTNAALTKSVEASLANILMVATRSGNLKGTFTKCLKEAVVNIRTAVSELRERSSSEEIKRLEAQNTQLLAQVADLRREMEELRRQAYRPAEKEIRQLMDEVSRKNLQTLGTMLDARLAGIEDRLLPEPRRRPALAVEVTGAIEAPKRKGPEPQKVTAAPTYADIAAVTTTAAAAKAARPAPARRRHQTKQPSLAAQEAAQRNEGATSSPSTAEGPHITDGSRKASKKKGVATPAKATPKKKKKKKRKVKLRSPTTAAVTLTLAADAAEKGVTYVGLLTQAKAAIDLGELGIPRLGFRLAETGARVLTIDGEGAQEKADAFAERLSPRVGPGINAGESHTPAPAGGRPMYTGGDNSAMGGEVTETYEPGNVLTDSDLLNDLALTSRPASAHLTASRPNLQTDEEELARVQLEREVRLGAATRIPRVLLTRLPTGFDRERDSDDDLSDSSVYSVMSLESGGSNWKGETSQEENR